MIQTTKGNIIEADAEALVNTVNCIGYMGKGIALQFKQAYPGNFTDYAQACKANKVTPGAMFVHETGNMFNPRYIINFPTKRHWRGKSRIEDIESGLNALVGEIRRRNIRSIAIPPLGCGLGGLDWNVVRPMIEKALADVPDVTVFIYEPHGAPEARTMPVHTTLPNMTPARALIIKLMERYSLLSYRLTLLEIHKFAYFLQESGEPLRLQFTKATYGPYAENLNKVLERLEGHYTRGYSGSRKPDIEIDLLPGASDAAEVFLAEQEYPRERLLRVFDLIEGFETPYGMELLASVHWVAIHEGRSVAGDEETVQAVHDWNDRKRRLFKPEHILIARDRLVELNWV